MTIEKRNSDILRLLEKKKQRAEKATTADRKAAAHALLAATGMYTAEGKLKAEFSESKKAS